jgi:hypothetical protein
MTRSMGDMQGKSCGVIAEPEVYMLGLNEVYQDGKTIMPAYVVLGSDGLWD